MSNLFASFKARLQGGEGKNYMPPPNGKLAVLAYLVITSAVLVPTVIYPSWLILSAKPNERIVPEWEHGRREERDKGTWGRMRERQERV